jgi:hypothetical protein
MMSADVVIIIVLVLVAIFSRARRKKGNEWKVMDGLTLAGKLCGSCVLVSGMAPQIPLKARKDASKTSSQVLCCAHCTVKILLLVW